ncbi:hypothetical protein ABT247_23995 [Kitasatospora sp. NPDC001539]|uniref:hypothetical protein n=1 Tax=Kitasatospora sp. NPDC001539 TaxID=3154384 RepID=UPI00331A8181
MNEHPSTTTGPPRPPSGPSMLLHPVGTVTATVHRVPGADAVGSAVNGVLDTVGLVSPRARRIAAYAGAGLLGALGAVEWPVAAAGAAAVWLTQPRPAAAEEAAAASVRPGPGKTASGGRSRTATRSRTTTKASGPAGTPSGGTTTRGTSGGAPRRRPGPAS